MIYNLLVRLKKINKITKHLPIDLNGLRETGFRITILLIEFVSSSAQLIIANIDEIIMYLINKE